MTVYYINLALILGLAYPLLLWRPDRIKRIAYIVVTLGWMWFIATFRYDIGNDYQAYIDIYESIRQTGSFGEWRAMPYEIGFILLTKLMTTFITSSTVMYGVYEFLILAPIGWFLYRHCKDLWLSTWLYVTLTFFYTTMNFVRQSLAVSVLVLAYGFLRDKKLVPYLIVVLLAISMHRTAFIMIPVYFVCHFPLNKQLGAAYGGATLLAFLFSAPILDLVTRFVFSEYRGTIYLEYGLQVSFLLIPAMVFGGCLALYPIWKKRDEYAPMLLNLMMYNAIVWLFLTRHFILERFSMYMYIFVLVALPAAIRALQADPAVFRERDELATAIAKEVGGPKKKHTSKEKQGKLAQLEAVISDHNKYYWSAVVAVLLVTLVYHEFGMYNNGFHGVFPYQSVLPWLP